MFRPVKLFAALLKWPMWPLLGWLPCAMGMVTAGVFVAAVPGEGLDLVTIGADGDLAVPGLAREEKPYQPIVVTLGNGIILVVVAPGAADRQSEKG